MLGKSATKIILEKLKETGKTHREITDELAKTDPRFTAEEERARQMQGTCDLLPYYGKILRNDTAKNSRSTISRSRSRRARSTASSVTTARGKPRP